MNEGFDPYVITVKSADFAEKWRFQGKTRGAIPEWSEDLLPVRTGIFLKTPFRTGRISSDHSGMANPNFPGRSLFSQKCSFLARKCLVKCGDLAKPINPCIFEVFPSERSERSSNEHAPVGGYECE